MNINGSEAIRNFTFYYIHGCVRVRVYKLNHFGHPFLQHLAFHSRGVFERRDLLLCLFCFILLHILILQARYTHSKWVKIYIIYVSFGARVICTFFTLFLILSVFRSQQQLGKSQRNEKFSTTNQMKNSWFSIVLDSCLFAQHNVYNVWQQWW